MDRTVCIVDDDEDMRELLARIVQSIGLTADLYDSAEAFLRRTESSEIGCMLVDIELRGMSGVALVKQLSGGGLGCPVFLISGAHDAVSAETAKRVGAVLIDKPFNARALAQTIRAAIGATGP